MDDATAAAALANCAWHAQSRMCFTGDRVGQWVTLQLQQRWPCHDQLRSKHDMGVQPCLVRWCSWQLALPVLC